MIDPLFLKPYDVIDAYVTFQTDGPVQPQSEPAQVLWQDQNPDDLVLSIDEEYLRVSWDYAYESSTNINGLDLHIREFS